MTTRTRRLLIGTAIVVVLLFVGRWGSEFLTERWWAATISPAAVAAITQWRLLGLLLDAMAISMASLWLILQAFTIIRVVKSVQIPWRIGNLVLLESVPPRAIVAGGIVVGILLGWIAGAGASAWRAPVALAWQGVSWGIKDPLLEEDLGRFVAQLPVWQLLLDYILTLLLLGMAFTASLYLGIGAIRRHERRVEIHPHAQRHLGVLLTVTAAALMVGYLMSPWVLAASAEGPTSVEGAHREILYRTVLAGVSLYTIFISWLWSRGAETSRLLMGWGILAAVHLLTLMLGREAPLTPLETTRAHEFNDLAWGVVRREQQELPRTRPVTAIWDERLLEIAEVSAGRHPLAVTATANLGDSAGTAGWLVMARDSARRSLRLRAVAEGVTAPDGSPQELVARTWAIESARSLPGAPAWDTVTSGVTAQLFPARLAIAWSRQAGGVLGTSGAAQLDWHLDPAERAGAILPMALWLAPDVVVDEGRPVWLVQGLLPVDAFPLSVRERIRGVDYAGLLPGFLALVDPESGAIRFYLDPAASPVAIAWTGFVPGLIASADSIPLLVRQRMPYSAQWLALQVAALRTADQMKGVGPSAPALGTPAVWTAQGLGRQALQWGGVVSLISRVEGLPGWSSDSTVRRFQDYDRRMRELPESVRLQDSVQAAGDTTITGALRWEPLAGGTLTWRPLVALTRSSGPRLTGVMREWNGRTVVVRSVRLIGADTVATAVSAADERDRQLAEARLWMLRADSALRRGDLTAFGRYFEGLQRVLGKP